mmetsp:Transcript_66749/g.159642  ORF Transcript_66749/g.159642 Transcript_66749/m.159642 type:complete len:678 (-) Transcript_66749:17-2050(-)
MAIQSRRYLPVTPLIPSAQKKQNLVRRCRAGSYACALALLFVILDMGAVPEKRSLGTSSLLSATLSWWQSQDTGGDPAFVVGPPRTCGRGRTSFRGGCPQRAKGGEIESSPPAQASATEEPTAGEPKAWMPFSTLAEQWGLLGFIVGLVASFGGLGFFMGGLPPADVVDVDSVLEYTSGLIEREGVVRGTIAAEPLLVEALGPLASASAVGLASGYAGIVVAGAREKYSPAGTDFLNSEFVASLRPPGELSLEAEQRLRMLFDACDKSGDGLVEVPELLQAFEENPDVAQFFIVRRSNLSDVEKAAKMAQLFAVMDSDKDNSITWQEFRAFCVRVRLEAGIQTEDRPRSAIEMGLRTFDLEWRQLLLAAATDGFNSQRRYVPSFVPQLVLSNEAVLERERAREAVPSPLPVKVVYDVLCQFLDYAFEDRPIARFWFLETVARMPYFAYTSVLHLYETMGWWRSPELRQVHDAEEDNEMHHLLIMESLGGDLRWFDRFLAQHGAIVYYWILVGFYMIDPRWSYNFSRLIETHAIDTYGEFVDANEELLRKLPPPPVAVEYYRGGNLYNFDKFQTSMWAPEGGIKKKDLGTLRRPPCSTLYDVFSNIRDDEEQHVLTMTACEEWVQGGAPPVALGYNFISKEEYVKQVESTPEGREAWRAWSAEVNALSRTGRRGPRSD